MKGEWSWDRDLNTGMRITAVWDCSPPHGRSVIPALMVDSVARIIRFSPGLFAACSIDPDWTMFKFGDSVK